MSKKMDKTLEKCVSVLSSTPTGANAWELAQALKLKKQESATARLATGKFTSRKRHLGYDLVQRSLRRGARLGVVKSRKTRAGNRVWFVKEAA
jgi:hypothetical protein